MKQYFGIIFLMCFFAFLGNGCKDDETHFFDVFFCIFRQWV